MSRLVSPVKSFVRSELSTVVTEDVATVAGLTQTPAGA